VTLPSPLVLATGNPEKIAEWEELLADLGVAIERGDVPEVVEDGGTCLANALLKAMATSVATGRPALGDDVGLEVDAWNGAPGAELKPWALSVGGWTAARRLAGATGGGATFRCALALVVPGRAPVVTEGTVRGSLAPPTRDERGLEPCFVPDGAHTSLAELPSELRRRFHHRHRALQDLLRLHSS
jgi:XTP/dITP diphosphohydrolase